MRGTWTSPASSLSHLLCDGGRAGSASSYGLSAITSTSTNTGASLDKATVALILEILGSEASLPSRNKAGSVTFLLDVFAGQGDLRLRKEVRRLSLRKRHPLRGFGGPCAVTDPGLLASGLNLDSHA